MSVVLKEATMAKQCIFKNKVNAFLDNELSQQERSRMKEHLLSCQSCQQELRELQKLNRILGKVRTDSPSIETMNTIRSLSSRIEKSPSRWIISGSIAASFIIGLMLSTLTFSTATQSQNDYQLGNNSLYSYFIGDEDVQ